MYFDQEIDKSYSPLKKDSKGWFRIQGLGDYSKESIARLDQEGRIYFTSKGKKYLKYYIEERDGRLFKKKKIGDVWNNITQLSTARQKEKTGYPTQKPLSLLIRIIKASSNKGDMIFDPFCGCATTLIAAEGEKRQWIGIDISPKAVDLVRDRLHKIFQTGEGNEEEFSLKRIGVDVEARTDVPIRSDHATPPSKDIKHVLFGQQRGICNGCKHDFLFQNFTLDHIQPTSKGGADTDANLQLLCNHCNSVKSDGTMADLIVRLRTGGYLH